ncbi:MAG: hypothetical protein ABI042_13700 [Verrucomicrobiota bacterium]
MDISDTIVDREILESGLEDVTGIYEVIWRLNTVFPSASIAAKYDAADRRVRELLRGGHIRLVRQFLGQTDRIEPVHATDIDAVLRSPTAWYPSDLSSGASQVAYETTDSGAPLYEHSKTVA